MQYGTNWLIQEYLGRALHAERIETQTIRNQTFSRPPREWERQGSQETSHPSLTVSEDTDTTQPDALPAPVK
mgnify:FL=1